MRQRLIKAIFFIALSVSVFFCSYGFAYAEETTESEEDLVAYIDSNANTQFFDLSPLADLEEDDYTGGALFQVLSQRASMYFQYQGFTFKDQGYSKAEGNYLGAYKLPVYLTIGFQVERGHTYSGAVSLVGSTAASLDEDFLYQMDTDQTYIGSFVFSGYDEVSPESVDVSVYPVLIYGSEADYTININFNNYQSTFDGYVYVNLTLHFDLATIIYSSNNPWWVQRSVAVVNTHATDWAGTLKDYPTNAIVDSDGSLIHNQTIQQQQIAEQQAQQSAQQHENLVNGYDNSQDKANQEFFDSVLSTHESQEHALLEEAMTNVSDVEMDLSWVDRLTATFSFIRTVFMAIVTASGDFGILITVTLCFALALFALGWFRN